MKISRKLLSAVALFTMFSAFDANAQSADLAVSAEVPEVCLIDSPDPLPLAFGVLNVALGDPGDYVRSANFIFRCSQGTTVDVALGLGLGPTPTLAARQMRGTNDVNNVLPYYLETPANGVWGSTVGTDTVNLTAQGINTQDTVAIQGTITLTDIQAANADQYNDTVVITLVL